MYCSRLNSKEEIRLKKIVIYSMLFILLLLTFVFANSYVHALSKQERIETLEQKVNNNQHNICRNIEDRPINCNNNCEPNNNCINRCPQKYYNCRRNCNK